MNSPQPNLATINLANDARLHDTGQYFCNQKMFAWPMRGNLAEVLHSGQEYFDQVVKAMQSAEKFIWIADWQMAFDVELNLRGDRSHPGRLTRVIENIIRTKPVQVRVLLYDGVTDSIPGTYDALVTKALNKLNKKGYPGKVIAVAQGSTSTQFDAYEYSHHQKFIVVDAHTAFIGGIDLTHGRFETPGFDVVIDPQQHVINDMYNPCTSKLRGMTPDEEALVKLGFAEPYGGTLVDEGCQARMPWQDVQIKMAGPSVVDIHRNFARRWNANLLARSVPVQKAARENAGLPARIDDAWFAHYGARATIEAAVKSRPGQATIQIVRSVSSRELHLESSSTNFRFQLPDDLALYPDAFVRKTMATLIEKSRNEHQANILNAMVNCIASADNYIYIESQFLISDFGFAGKPKTRRMRGGAISYYPVDSTKIGNENDGIKNVILDALGARIGQHVAAGSPFHVYLVLPVHPEGSIADPTIWKQHWLAMASVRHGTRSLIARIKAALKGAKRDPEEWSRYLTVLNMRNYGVAVQYARDPKTFREDYAHEIGRFVITEQIYVHSKMMIVDDAVAIVGSANINDRSLTGNGDTEIAAVVVDDAGVELRDLGNPQLKVVTRKFARELRRSLWEKHFGFALNQNAYFNTTARAERAGFSPVPLPEVALPPRDRTTDRSFERFAQRNWSAVLDQPCSELCVGVIQFIAKRNAKAYETVFKHTPRNDMAHFEDVLAPFDYPYPVSSEAMVRFAAREAERTRQDILRNAPAYGLSEKDAQVRADAAYRQRMAAAPGAAGEKMLGVVPPALNPGFMTDQLQPHQRETAGVPLTDFGRRYITYDQGKVHDIEGAMKYLKANILGFFVMAPLDWGHETDPGSDPSGASSIDISAAEPEHKGMGRVPT